LRLVAEIGDELERRRAAAASAWDLSDSVVLVHAGEEIPVPGRGDRTYPFRSHTEYLYLTDRERPKGVLAFDPGEGWIEFVNPVTPEELLWTGLEGDREGVPEGTRALDELEDWLGERPARRLGATDEPDEELRNELIRVRRPKDDVELERMRVAEAATRAGFADLVRMIEPGVTERELQVSLEATFLRSGADFLAYESIVAAGDHSAVLHFSPTSRELEAGRLLLVDAGAEYRGYASDVTRTYPIGGELDGEQRLVWETVRRALEAAIDTCTPGVEWREVHRTAALIVGEGLVELGVLRGEAETLLESGAITLFLPHGIGHMVGLGIRDAGVATDEIRDQVPGFPRMRLDIPLQPRHVWTVEPGIYFVAPLLARHRDRTDVDWDRVDSMLGFGGVRIEHDVLITDDAREVLTADIPL
jgi:Xaa-Pro aminopeptidase